MRPLLFALLLLCSSGPAAAQSEADRSAVQGVIAEQLGAFGRDDAATAYSFASPGIKAMFPTAEIFMNLVRQGYAPVYRQKSYSFGELKAENGVFTQAVDIVDAEGIEWTAVYTLEKQADGAWKITACYLVKKPGIAV